MKTVNNISLTRYIIQLVLYRITRIGGSIPMMLLLICFGVYVFSQQGVQSRQAFEANETLFGAFFIGWLACKIFYPQLEPGDPPKLYQDPPPPPPPPPRATAGPGRTDDPDEATVIGRLDPKLRELLRQKNSGKPS